MTDVPFTCRPLTSDNWPDLVNLFGPRGASGGCWCMYNLLPRKQFHANKGDENRELFHKVVDGGLPVGLIAYDGETPAGWIAISDRVNYAGLAKSKLIQPVDVEPVWSITCFYTARAYRRKGINRFLVQKAVEYAAGKGARTVEAYPVDNSGKMQDASAYIGFASVFAGLGFQEVARPYASRPVMRILINP
jgi:GNAT superfamily N-acetyltransferase